MELSVIICTHNPRLDYLTRVLDALRKQTLTLDQWELIVVDNASTNGVVAQCDLSWHPNSRSVVESQLGLTYARQRGMHEAKSDLLVFVDDDNVLESDYLLEAVKIKHEWPPLGVWGSGATIPEFEIELPRWPTYTISQRRDNTQVYWSNVPDCAQAAPWGAGLCLRADVAAVYCEQLKQASVHISDRQGSALWSGGDAEICIVACRAGYGMAVFPQLRLIHLIPGRRLTKRYVVSMTKGLVASDILLEYKWSGTVPPSPFSPRRLASMILRVLFNRGMERRMQFAKWHAAITAKRIIDDVRTRKNGS